MSTNDHYNINPPRSDMFKVIIYFHHSKTHWCIMDVKNPSQVKIYSWWNTVIRSERMQLMYLSTESTILPPGTTTFNIFFLESKTEDTEQQYSVAASEVSSWTS